MVVSVELIAALELEVLILVQMVEEQAETVWHTTAAMEGLAVEQAAILVMAVMVVWVVMELLDTVEQAVVVVHHLPQVVVLEY
jgi:hypothetical protein